MLEVQFKAVALGRATSMWRVLVRRIELEVHITDQAELDQCSQSS